MMAPIEEKVVNSLPFAMTRLWFTKHTKSGKFPSAKLGTVHYAKTKPNFLQVDHFARRPGFRITKEGVDGSVEGTLTGSSKIDRIALGRVLVKAALGAMTLERGRDYILDSRFDPARNFVQTGNGLHTRLLVKRKVKPKSHLAVRWWDFPNAGVPVVIVIHGIEFMLGATPASDLPPPPAEVADEFLVFELA